MFNCLVKTSEGQENNLGAPYLAEHGLQPAVVGDLLDDLLGVGVAGVGQLIEAPEVLRRHDLLPPGAYLGQRHDGGEDEALGHQLALGRVEQLQQPVQVVAVLDEDDLV